MLQRQTKIDPARIPQELLPVVQALAGVSAEVARIIARGPLEGALGAEVGENTDGDQQKALDVRADVMFAEALQGAGVRFYASEERDTIEELDAAGSFALAIDPLDGSSNIDTNVSIGTIFSVFEAAGNADASFLRPAHEQIAAGYVIYGPRTSLLITFGEGSMVYTLDPDSHTFVLTNDQAHVPAKSTEYAINASNYRHWTRPVRAYIDDLVAGAEGPRETNFNMRWIASLVAETHRILTRGGIFLYPSDDRQGYERGRLRFVYECAPIAMLIEQAGGKATDGQERILDQTARDLHARTPFVFGSTEKVDRMAAYHDLPEQELSALFNTRGLFRA